jgi:hypothetical protein
MYSTISAWNADESKIILYKVGTGHQLYDGKTYAYIQDLNINPADVEQVYWHTTDPDVFFYVDTKTLIRYHVSSGVKDQVHTFTNCSSSVSGGGDPMFMSWDSNRIGLSCGSTIFTYDIAANTILGQTTGSDTPQFSPSGTLTYMGPNTGNVTDAALNTLRTLDVADPGSHASLGRYASGNDTYNAVTFDPGPKGTPVGTLVTYDMTTGAAKVVVGPSTGYPYPPSGTHVAALAYKQPGWIFLSIVGDTAGQGVLDQELVVADTNTSTVCRIGHHRSYGKNNTSIGDSYWAEPHVIPSPSGTRALFGSDWGNGPSVDTYVVELPSYSSGGSSNPSLTVSPGSLAFGSVNVGSTADLSVTVKNVGGGTLTGSASTAAPFSIVGTASYSLTANQTATITVRFSPTGAGTVSGTATFTGGGGGSVSLGGTGVAVATPILNVSPGSLAFGSVTTGYTADLGVTVKNVGGGTLSGTASTAAPFSVVGTASYSLTANQTATITVRFSPTATGTASGTLTLTGGGGGTVTLSGTGTAPGSTIPVGDLNGDGRVDLLWRNQSSGLLYAWFMNGVTQSSGAYLNPSAVDSSWVVVGMGDFNGDGKTDLLWWQQTTGILYVWYMNGVVRTGGAYLSPAQVPDTNWKVEGVADLNGDKKPDILWRNQVTGELYVWFMDGVGMTSGAYVTPSRVSDTNWKIEAVADLNGDGKPDLIWRHQTFGTVYVWYMNGAVQTGGAYLSPSAVADTHWRIESVGDFNGDGKPDLVWRNTATGSVYAWFMNGVTMTGGAYLTPAAVTDTTWVVAGPH